MTEKFDRIIIEVLNEIKVVFVPFLPKLLEGHFEKK